MAAHLTGYRIDIKSATEFESMEVPVEEITEVAEVETPLEEIVEVDPGLEVEVVVEDAADEAEAVDVAEELETSTEE